MARSTCFPPVPGLSGARDSPVLTLLLILLAALILVPLPAAAHSGAMAPGMVDYANGIDDLWPIHAGLMTGGIAGIVTAAGIVQFGKKTRWWYRAHPVFALSGAVLSVGAIAVAFVMVANSEQPHLQYLHGWIGSVTIAALIAAPLLMIFRKNLIRRVPSLPRVHRLTGFAVIGLMAVNILLGLSMMHVI